MDASNASPAVPSGSTKPGDMARSGFRQQSTVMEVIDLTESPPTTPTLTYRPPPAIAPRDERPTKRPRTVGPPPSAPIQALPRITQTPRRLTPVPIQPASSTGIHRPMGTCLQTQVVPLLRPLLKNVPSAVAADVTTTVVRGLLALPAFQTEVQITRGYLSQPFLQSIKEYLRTEISKELAKRPANRQVEQPPKQAQGPPAQAPPVQTPPIQAPPIQTPPIQTPPIQTPPIQTPPAQRPPIQRPTLQAHVAPPPPPPPQPGVAAPSHVAQYQQSRPSRTKTKTKAKISPQVSSLALAGKYSQSQQSTSNGLPYLPVFTRKSISAAASRRLALQKQQTIPERLVYHVDFSRQEIEAVRAAIRRHEGKEGVSRKEPLRELGKILRRSVGSIESLAQSMCLKGGLEHRDTRAVFGFLQDAVRKQSTDPARAQTLTLQIREPEPIQRLPTKKRVSSLLLAREIEGNRGFGRMRRHVNFTQEFRKAREDDMDLRAEWTNCAGDIATISWVGDGQHFVCGTTTHSDSHNQQYNKPGNLLLCSPDKGRLQAYADHRIARPIVGTGENSTDAMRESQEPWLYSSVVSSDYDAVNRLAYTSSFDKTVKVWSIDEDAGTMKSVATWPHEGVVNFVAASKNGSGLIATAADVPNLAVRIYKVDRAGMAQTYLPLAGLRSWNEDDQTTSAPQTWAYFPATMQWGIAKDAQHLLLVGYSPRSLTGDDNDIPPEKRNSGEILLWDCIKNERCRVLTATTQNVFEVAWHPTQPCFVVATSPSGLLVKEGIRTQIRVFRPSYSVDQVGAFSEVQCLDCKAIDINELTIVPNSLAYCYVTAAATDGRVYVWDTALGDDPVHMLEHGTPLEGDATEEHYVRERDDTGVKFTAWGASLDRFYTGGSDGVVKIWNVRNQRKPLVRVILEAPAPISTGSFSPDKTKLAIGDATGRVYLFSVNEMEALEKTAVKLPPGFAGNVKPIRRPRPYTLHPTPTPPPSNNPNPEPTTGIELAARYVALGQIRITPKRAVGAVQGPAYSSLGLYRDELHMEGVGQGPLLAHVEQQQQVNQTMFKGIARIRTLPKPVHDPSTDMLHGSNYGRDLHLSELPEETQLELRMAGINLENPIEDDITDWELRYEED